MVDAAEKFRSSGFAGLVLVLACSCLSACPADNPGDGVGDDVDGSEDYTSGFPMDTDTGTGETGTETGGACEGVICDDGQVCDPLSGQCIDAASCTPDRSVVRAVVVLVLLCPLPYSVRILIAAPPETPDPPMFTPNSRLRPASRFTL